MICSDIDIIDTANRNVIFTIFSFSVIVFVENNDNTVLRCVE